MQFILKLRKLAMDFLNNKNAVLNYDIDLQKKYLSEFREPKDDIDRSFFQYRCQMKLYGFWYKLMVNMASPALILLYLIQNYKGRVLEDKEPQNSLTALFFTNSLTDDYLPVELTTEFRDIKNVELLDHSRLTSCDLKYFWRLIVSKHPFSWFFQFKILMKIGVYSEQIAKYQPRGVIVSAEYSFTSSAMTDYCNKINIQHINIQHGEKVFYMEDAFFHFNKCYLWDSVYQDILTELRAESSQFLISVPPLLVNVKKKIEYYRQIALDQFDCTYYLAGEDKTELIKIKQTLLMLPGLGNRICVRPHPRYGDQRLLKELFDNDFIIEDTGKITIEESLARCKLAVSLRSTVLTQAYFGGVDSAIDDVSFPEHYRQLNKIKFAMISKSRRLSQITEMEIKKDE